MPIEGLVDGLIGGFWGPLLVKMAVTALVVVAASATAERAGPFWGAIVASLPVSAGPAYVMLAMRSGPDFVSESALASAAGSAATLLYVAMVVRMAPHRRLAAVLAGGIALWFAAAVPIRLVDWTAATAALLVAATFVLCFGVTRGTPPAPPPKRAVGPAWYDLPLRALLVGSLVATVVTASDAIGPIATGIAAMFPISFTCLALVVQPRLGGAALAAVMSSALRPMIGFCLALFVLHLAAPAWGSTVALTAALGSTLAWSGGLIAWNGRARWLPAFRR